PNVRALPYVERRSRLSIFASKRFTSEPKWEWWQCAVNQSASKPSHAAESGFRQNGAKGVSSCPGEMTDVRALLPCRPLAATLIAAVGVLAVLQGATALDFKRAENVGGLHLRIPIEYIAGGHDDEGF